MDEAFGKDTDAMIAIDHHDFGVTVGINRMICKAYLVSLASGIHDEIFGNQIEIQFNWTQHTRANRAHRYLS
jgi:hypothetical protein